MGDWLYTGRNIFLPYKIIYKTIYDIIKRSHKNLFLYKCSKNQFLFNLHIRKT